MIGCLVNDTFRAIGRPVWLAVVLLVTIWGSVSCRETMPEPTTAPEIVALEVLELSYDSALLTATVNDGGSVERCGFLLFAADGKTYQIPGVVSQNDSFTAKLDSLKSESLYRFQAFVENGRNLRITSPQKEFTTAAAPVVPVPEIAYVTVSEITSSGARLIAAVNYDFPLSQVGFIVRAQGADRTTTIVAELEGHGFTCTLTDLDNSRVYFFKAFVESESGIRVESEEQTFTTADEVDPIQFISVKATQIAQDGALLIASLSYAQSPTSVGFLIRPAEEEEEFLLTTTLDQENNLFIREISGLKPGTKYVFQAFADCAGHDRFFSDIKHFETLSSDPDPDPDPEYVTIPDDHFREWVLWRYDFDRDGKLSLEEAALIETVELNTDETASVEGIQMFPSLKKLHAEGTRVNDSGLGQLTTVDVSGNPELRSIFIQHNQIDTLNLRSAVKLEIVDCAVNKLRSIDLSMQKRVYLLNVSYNQIKTLDFSGLPLLVEAHCESQPLETLTLDNPELVYLDCSRTHLSTLNLTKCPKINTVDCSECPYLKTIYLVKGQTIGVLRCSQSVNIVYL